MSSKIKIRKIECEEILQLSKDLNTTNSTKRKKDKDDSEDSSKKIRIDNQEEKEVIKFSKEFNVSNFRTKLRENDFITGYIIKPYIKSIITSYYRASTLSSR